MFKYLTQQFYEYLITTPHKHISMQCKIKIVALYLSKLRVLTRHLSMITPLIKVLSNHNVTMRSVEVELLWNNVTTC